MCTYTRGPALSDFLHFIRPRFHGFLGTIRLDLLERAEYEKLSFLAFSGARFNSIICTGTYTSATALYVLC